MQIHCVGLAHLHPRGAWGARRGTGPNVMLKPPTVL